MSVAAHRALFPVVGVRSAGRSETDALLQEWEHPLGPCRRPFGQQGWVMEEDGRPLAVAVSASTVSRTVEGYSRQEVVELARLARAPDEPHALRPLLRLWRVYLAPRWPYWPVSAAVAYAMPGTLGDLYRFDGWERVGRRRKSPGGGTWTIRDPAVSRIGDGIKTLWLYRYRGSSA